MTVEELISLGKNKVRSSEVLVALFEGFFMEAFDRKPKVCCTFSDFDLLKAKYFTPKYQTMRLSKYSVLYPREKILAYLKNGKVHRAKAGSFSDNFIEEFLKYGNRKVYPELDKMIAVIGERKVSKKIEEVEIPSATDQMVYTDTPKPRTKKKRSPKKKKDE